MLDLMQLFSDFPARYSPHFFDELSKLRSGDGMSFTAQVQHPKKLDEISLNRPSEKCQPRGNVHDFSTFKKVLSGQMGFCFNLRHANATPMGLRTSLE
jgi:hypothetical protein